MTQRWDSVWTRRPSSNHADSTDEKYLGTKHIQFQSGGEQRHALSFGQQKINLHLSGKEFEPKAQIVQPGSADLCFLIEDNVDQVLTDLLSDGLTVLEGSQVVNRTGARMFVKPWNACH